eukprot:scaffold273131_cov36-Tisochrysis_lutea.AAC.1
MQGQACHEIASRKRAASGLIGRDLEGTRFAEVEFVVYVVEPQREATGIDIQTIIWQQALSKAISIAGRHTFQELGHVLAYFKIVVTTTSQVHMRRISLHVASRTIGEPVG